MPITAKRKSSKGQDVSTSDCVFDHELEDLPHELHWREWMGRIDAVLFACVTPVGRDDLARVVGLEAAVEMLIDDIQMELTRRPYEFAQDVGGGCVGRERSSRM